MMMSELSFYPLDAVSSKSKVMNLNVGFFQMVPKIIAEEGFYGLFKGYSAAYYSSMYSGFIYFYVYKVMKG